MRVPATSSRFEAVVLEHLDAAHNLARWLVRNEQDAQDVVQESCLKALRAFESLRGADFRPWFLAIVRNTSLSLLTRRSGSPVSTDEQGLQNVAGISADGSAYDPQAIAIRAAEAERVRGAISALPHAWREVVVLREMEGLSYKEIGKVIGVPIGTVMSRLARGRTHLQSLLMGSEREACDDLR